MLELENMVIGFPDIPKPYRRQLSDDIEIVKEYELIQQKKSSLSRWEREEVTRIVEKFNPKRKGVNHG